MHNLKTIIMVCTLASGTMSIPIHLDIDISDAVTTPATISTSAITTQPLPQQASSEITEERSESINHQTQHATQHAEQELVGEGLDADLEAAETRQNEVTSKQEDESDIGKQFEQGRVHDLKTRRQAEWAAEMNRQEAVSSASAGKRNGVGYKRQWSRATGLVAVEA